MPKDHTKEQIPEEHTETNINQNVTKDQFKIAIENERGQINDQFTELTKTKSGRLAMELDEQIIELIEKKSKQDTYLFVSLKKTDSGGHLLVDFDTKENIVTDSQRVTVRRTPSGTRLLDMHKDIINKLKDTLSDDKPNFSTSKSIKLSPSPTREESPNRINSFNYSPPIDSIKQKSPEYNDKENNLPSQDVTKQPYQSDKTKVKKYVENEIKPSTFLTEGKIYERRKESQTSLSWKSVSVEDKYSLSSGNKNIGKVCNCSPENTITYNWKSGIPIADNKTVPPKTMTTGIECKNRKAGNTNEKLCNCPPCPQPPVDYRWKPGDSVLKEEHDCVCPRDIPPSICCQPASDTDRLNEIKTECDCPNSQTSYSWKSATSKSLISLDECDYVSELMQLYKQGNSNIAVKIRGEKGVVRKLLTVVTRTPSDTIAIYCKNMSSLGDISFEQKEYPVLLSKTGSGTYFVGIGKYDVALNAILKKTLSGGMLLIPKSNQKESIIKPGLEEYFKVKVTGVRDYPVVLPAVLKTTPSDNYIIVLDKEFEKRYRQTVKEYIETDSECVVDLNRSNSGNYVIDLDIEDDGHLIKRNALLVKSSSGDIKVLVHGPDFDSMVQSASKKSSSSSAKPFGKLINKLPASSRQFHRENLRKSKFLDKRASSDTEIYGKVRVKLQDNKRLLSEPSAILKKTDSGQYAIILNKESKKTFISNLQSYLSTNSKGLVPIKRTDSGEIIIILNNNVEEKGHYGSLKITSSGNIYVVVDEEAIKGMAKDSRKNDVSSVDDSRCKRDTESIVIHVNKAVTTTCHARPQDCECDASKCVCGDLQLETVDWLHNNSQKAFHQNPSCFWRKYTVEPDCNRRDNCCVIAKKDRDTPIDKSPHIVIKPACDCQPADKKFGSMEQCYYLLDSVCPYHTDRYDNVSNEILEISGCHKAQENSRRNKIEFEANNGLPINIGQNRKTWDSLNYLPPQLPPFLSNVRYQ